MKSTFNYNALGQRVRKRRKELQLTQEQLAEACNLSAAHIGHIERGTRALSIESLLTLADILDVSTDYLLLDITPAGERHPDRLFHAMDNTNPQKMASFYAIVKILAEHIDQLP